jgi:hypothetical protein
MKHRVRHALDVQSARRALEPVLAAYLARFADFAPSLRWLDGRRGVFGFVAKGRQVNGSFALSPGALDIEVEVPWAFRVFWGHAVGVVDAELRRIFGEAQDRMAFAHGC